MGPSGKGNGSGDAVAGDVIFKPFLTAPIMNCAVTAGPMEIRLPTLQKAAEEEGRVQK